MANHKEKFSKPERLCSKKSLETLFENGKSFYCSSYLVVWSNAFSYIPFPAQVAFSVPKREFKLAVTRNLIKRRTREAYRKNKSLLYDFLIAADKKIIFIMIFREKSVQDYAVIENSIKEMIHKFIRIIGES